MLLSLSLITILALETIALGWSIALDARQDIAILVLHVLVAAYITSVSVGALYHDSPYLHSDYMIHLSGLTFIAFAPLAISALVPNEPISVYAELEDMTVKGLYYAVIVFYGVSCALAITTPLGPALHYPKELIYSEKTVTSITNQAHDNVCGVTGKPHLSSKRHLVCSQSFAGASVWDYLLFSYTTKVVMLGNTATSLDIGDLPIVPGNMRATSIFAAMRSTIRTVKLRGFLGWTPSVGQGWELAWRVLHVNQHALMVQVALAAVTAMLFYAPAYFLRKVVQYLETDPQRNNTSWGWFYSVGLFAATATVHIR